MTHTSTVDTYVTKSYGLQAASCNDLTPASEVPYYIHMYVWKKHPIAEVSTTQGRSRVGLYQRLVRTLCPEQVGFTQNGDFNPRWRCDLIRRNGVLPYYMHKINVSVNKT